MINKKQLIGETMNTNKFGRVRVGINDIASMPTRVVDAFYMLKFIPIRIKESYFENVIEYIGISEYFKEIQEGSIVPEYVIEFTENKNGKIIDAKFKQI